MLSIYLTDRNCCHEFSNPSDYRIGDRSFAVTGVTLLREKRTLMDVMRPNYSLSSMSIGLLLSSFIQAAGVLHRIVSG